MSSITIDEAARYLGVTTRTISTYISQGLLSYHKKQGSNKKYITVSDVHDFKVAKENDEFSTKKFRELQARVRKLEAQIDVLMRILDTKQLPLGLTEDECVELFTAAEASANERLTVDHVDAWLPVLLRIDENDLSTIEKNIKTARPWVPFLDLCLSLIVFVTSHKEYNMSLELQASHKELAEARRRLRLSALLYLEAKGPSIEVDKLALGAPDTTVEIVKKIVKSRHK